MAVYVLFSSLYLHYGRNRGTAACTRADVSYFWVIESSKFEVKNHIILASNKMGKEGKLIEWQKMWYWDFTRECQIECDLLWSAIDSTQLSKVPASVSESTVHLNHCQTLFPVLHLSIENLELENHLPVAFPKSI